MCQAAAGQFRSTTQDTLIAVAFVLCSICSTVFFFNCFLLAYLLKLDIPALFRRSPVKGTYQRRFLRFEQWDRSGCDCRTSFTPPSQRSHPTALPTAPALPAPPAQRAAASPPSWKGSANSPHSYFLSSLAFFLVETAQFWLSLKKKT